jgi:hypothetical protein
MASAALRQLYFEDLSPDGSFDVQALQKSE